MLRPALLETLCALALALNAPAARAQTVTPAATLTEHDLFARWVDRSREVASIRAQVGSARFDVVTAGLWPNPQLQFNTLVTATGTPPDGQANYGAQVSFTLPVFGQLAGRRAAAEAALRASEVGALAALWERASDLQRALVERAFADARVTLTQRNLDELGRVAHVVERRVAAGSNSEYDALRVATAVATLRAGLDDALATRAEAESRILAVIADETLRAAPITREGLAPFRGPEDLAALTALALARRPDLELARRGVRVARALATRYEREVAPAPSVWLGGYVSHEQFSVSVLGGVSLSLPTFDRNQGLIGRARTDAGAQQALSEALSTRIRFEVEGAWRAREAARAALDTFRRTGRPAAEALLRRADVTYVLGGNFGISDLLDAYRTMWDARAQELALERTFADAEAELERATGLIMP